MFLFWKPDSTFEGWYVNLEQRQRRTPIGFDFEDELLDVWIAPGAEPEWLDEDELEEAVRRGAVTGQRAEAVRRSGENVLAHLDEHVPTGWEDWRPDPGWQLPRLPPGWDALF